MTPPWAAPRLHGELACRLVGLVLVAAAGCYSPNIVSGSLLCATGTNACPDGFTCVGTVCVRPDAAVTDLVQDRQTDTPLGTDRPVEKPQSDGSSDGVCVPPVMGCIPQAGVCDPVCQTGCCGSVAQKCSVGLDEKIACFDLKGQRPTWQACQILNYATSEQNDTCTPGDICLQPGGPGASGDFCFPLCRTSADCTLFGSACVERPIGPPDSLMNPRVTLVCDVPFMNCDPLGAPGSDCPATQPYCYLYNSDSDKTVCEFKIGPGSQTSNCAAARDCVNSWTCPTGNTMGAGVCHPVCEIAAPNCSVGSRCIGTGTKYGYCFP
jgi:hypothetical protein